MIKETAEIRLIHLIDTFRGIAVRELKTGETVSQDYFKGLNYFSESKSEVISNGFIIHGRYTGR